MDETCGQLGGRLKGKVALITGAALGMGRQACIQFANEGACIVGLDVKEAELQETVAEVSDGGGRMLGIRADITSAEDVSAAIDQGVSHFGGLHIVYNNAAILLHGDDTSVVDTPEEVWDRVMDVNVKGMYLVCKYSIPKLMESGGGSIINTSSISAFLGETNPADCYCASKGAVIGLTHSLAVWLAPHGIRVNALLPGMIVTPMQSKFTGDPEWVSAVASTIPMARLGTVEDIAPVALFLASDESRFMTGADVIVDGGCAVI